MRVLISAAGSPAAVSILRHLRSLGHLVIGIDAGAESEPLAREFCDEFHLAPLGTAPEYLPWLLERLAHVDVFLPFVDEELLAIAAAWREIPAALAQKIALSDPDVILDCVDKRRFQDVSARKGLPVAPEVSTGAAFYKPRYGRGGRGVVRLADEKLFAAFRGRDGVFQREIVGAEYTIDAIYARDGALVGCSPRRRLRAAGVSTIGEVVPDAGFTQLAQRVGAAWPFRYAINIQAIRDAAGHDWIIEINPRLAGSAIFSAMAGCDPFAATLAIWAGEPWSGAPRPLRVWRYWQEYVPGQAP